MGSFLGVLVGADLQGFCDLASAYLRLNFAILLDVLLDETTSQ